MKSKLLGSAALDFSFPVQWLNGRPFGWVSFSLLPSFAIEDFRAVFIKSQAHALALSLAREHA